MSTFTQIPIVGTEVRRNLCMNPSFKLQTTERWAASTGAATITTTASDPVFGLDAIAVSVGAVGTVQVRHGSNASDRVTVTPGQYVHVQGKMWVRNPDTGNRTGQASVAFYGPDGTTQVGASVAGALVTIDTTWPREVVSVTNVLVPAGAAYMSVFFRITDGTTGINQVFYLDEAIFERTTATVTGTPGYFDGDTPNVNDFDNYRWIGTIGMRESQQVVVNPAVDQISPTFGPVAPLTMKQAAANLVHPLLDDPSKVWTTSRPAGLRSGEWKLTFKDPAAAAAALPRLSAGVWRYDSDLPASGVNVSRWLVPDGSEITMAHADPLTAAASATDWTWVLTVPWQEVSA